MSTPKISAVLALVAGLPAVCAAQTPQPTQGSEMHVTVPSLPGQPNKSGTVRPDGGMPMDSEGYAVTKRYDPNAPKSAGAPPSGGGAAAGGATASGSTAAPYIPPVGPAPSGKAVATGANYVTIRGTVKEVKAKAVVVKVKKTGATLTYTLAANASVPADLKPGDPVKVRVLAAQKGRVADKVERLPAQ